MTISLSFLGEYESNLRCPEVGACLPCRDRFVSCKGSPNGNFSIQGRPSEYKICMDSRVIEVRKCAGNGVYDQALGGCQITFDPREFPVEIYYCVSIENQVHLLAQAFAQLN